MNKIVVDSQCFHCQNYIAGRHCLAYVTKEIPSQIFLNKKIHNKILKGQDGKFIYKPFNEHS